MHEDDNGSTMESTNIEDIHLENIVNDYFFKKRMHTSRRLRSTMKKSKFDLLKDSSDMEISDESSSINSDNYHSSDDSDFDIYDDYTNETESINDDKP